MIRILRFVIVVLLCSCCDSNPETPVLTISDYFPLQKGRYFLFDVDDTQIAFNVETRSLYEMKIVVNDSMQNETGGYTYVLNRYKRLNANSSWTPLATWSVRQNADELVIKEGNTSYVALASPLFETKQWNGNEYNNLGGNETCSENSVFSKCDLYSISEIDGSLAIGNTPFENVLIVVEQDEPDFITIYDVRKVSYAKSVGIISVEKEVLEYCTDPRTCGGTRFVNKGFRYKQTLKEHGKE
jgi:hypothetical protein